MQEMDNIIGQIRAWFRLMGLLVITVATVIRLKARRIFLGNDLFETASFAQTWARVLVGSLGVKLTVRGQPQEGTVMYLANHRSYIDIPAILSHVPCAFLAKKEVGEWPVLGYATRLANTVYVDRECRESRKAARVGTLNILKQGLPFAAFPEGTTSKVEGTLPFYNGMFEVAAQNGYTVVPVAIQYGDIDDAWIDQDPFTGHFLDRFRKPHLHVTVSFGPPLRSTDAQELKAKTRTWIVEALQNPVIEDLDELPELVGEYPQTEGLADLSMVA